MLGGVELPVIARVECRCESEAEERPEALWIGGVRQPIRGFFDSAVIGGREAGDPITRSFTVELPDRVLYRLERTLPDGDWRVSRLIDG